MPVSESKKTLQATRKAAGLCIDCGAEADGKSRCPRCRDRQKKSRQKTAAKKKAQGVCQQSGCDTPAMKGRTVCQSCSAKAGEASSKRYHERKADPNETRCHYCNNPAVHNGRCQSCHDRIKQSQQARYEKLKTQGVCVQCNARNAVAGNTLCQPCTEQRVAHNRKQQLKLKLAAFDAYGGPVCVGCGFDTEAILEIDHIDGGGNQHRKEIGQGRLYIWLRDNGYPPGYRVLCPTCNKLAHKQIPLPLET
jgi:hypothetical protein